MKLLTAIATSVIATLITTAFGASPPRRAVSIAPVSGESWLHHLHRSFDETSMGKTWNLGPADISSSQYVIPTTSIRFKSSAPQHLRIVRGSDLYRLNCQGCHRKSGLGAPPEIASLIDPVRATSAALVEQKMKKIGTELSRRQTLQMTREARNALFKRLHDGGTGMPSFEHLNKLETRSLVTYLQKLAGVPGAKKENAEIQEPNARVGELIVKSTCHICHSATGSNPTPVELLEGAIPPLNSLPERVTKTQLVRKVTQGAPVIMGAMPWTVRGRMPVLDYITTDEAEDVYTYLIQYPPTQFAEGDDADKPPASNQAPIRPREAALAQLVAPPRGGEIQEQHGALVLPLGLGLIVIILVALECWVSFRELRKLSRRQRPDRSLRPTRIVPAPAKFSDEEAVMISMKAPPEFLERKIS
jgi:mono/diheme cytochrome c family protein